ncbi:MAG: hypothetical protein HQL15_04995 [Candidatus Omnitrophica bacterium]|nr:hypothetical protein [Candidatus Omnitrophota bacterium]
MKKQVFLSLVICGVVSLSLVTLSFAQDAGVPSHPVHKHSGTIKPKKEHKHHKRAGNKTHRKTHKVVSKNVEHSVSADTGAPKVNN